MTSSWPITGQATAYDAMELDSNRVRSFLVSWRHQMITWKNANFSFVRFCDIHIMSLKVILLKLLLQLPPHSVEIRSMGVPHMYFLRLRSNKIFGRIRLCCGWMWLACSMGRPLLTLGLACICFVPRDFCPWEGFQYPVPTPNFDIYFKNIIRRARQKSTNIHAGLKLEWSLHDEYYWSWKLPFSVFSSHPLKFTGLMQTLSDHKSMHSRRGNLCGSVALWLTGSVRAMRDQRIQITNTAVSPKGFPALNKYTQQVHTIAYTTCVDMRLNEPLRVVFMLWRANELKLLTQQWVQRVFQTTQ